MSSQLRKTTIKIYSESELRKELERRIRGRFLGWALSWYDTLSPTTYQVFTSKKKAIEFQDVNGGDLFKVYSKDNLAKFFKRYKL